jgi:3-oxoacyl-[acyl-carrier-protein] synthase-3
MKTVINNISIKAITAYLPENELDMKTLSSLYGEKQVNAIIKATGVQSTRVAPEDITSSDMCRYAAEDLFEKECIDRADIDGVVFVSQTADYILPSTSVCLQERLGLSKDTVCIDIHYGCSGYIYGLFQAACWINAGMCNNVLVLAGDTTSRLINPNDRSLRMVFGDCGTCTLVSRGDSQIGVHIQSDGSGADRLIVPAGGFRIPMSSETSILEYDIDKNGRTKNDLYMDGMAIFEFALANVHKNIFSLLETMQWTSDQIGMYALHQANAFMVNCIRKKLKAESNIVPINVSKYGNTGPATIPLLLSDVCSDTHSFDMSHVVMAGFGVGLSWGSIATDLSITHFYKPINK